MTTKAKANEKQEAIEHLRELLKPGDTVYTVLRHTSGSGMSRSISPVIIREDRPIDLTYWVAQALGYQVDSKRHGVKMGGCGMDMGFHLVMNLSYSLFPDGFTCIGDDCPSNDHSNGDRNYEPHLHASGGYALKHNWL